MGKYTKVSKEADLKVQEDLNKIIKIIVKRINPISIILFGGFGKGEGMVEVNGKKITPLNDYDIYVVNKGNINEKLLDSTALECAKAIGKEGLDFVEHSEEKYDRNKFFHIDLRNLNYNKLHKLLPTQRTFELKNSSQIIYGEDVRHKMPSVVVPISDAIRILFNKMDHLLIAEDKNKEIKAIYSIKAFLDLCSALLIFKKDFAGCYEERNKIIKKYDFPKELIYYINWATKFRNKPDFNNIRDVNLIYEEAKKWIAYGFKYIITKYLKLFSDDWKVIAREVYKKLPYKYFNSYLPSRFLFFLQYYLNIKYVLTCFRKREFIIKPLFSWRDVGLKLSIPLFLYLYGEKRLSKYYLKKITSKINPLKQRILDLYGYYYLQKLI